MSRAGRRYFCLCLLVASSTSAAADNPARQGLLVGFSFGGVGMYVTGTDTYVAGLTLIDLRLGATLHPKLAIMAELILEGAPEAPHAGIYAAAQSSLTDRLWLRGGVGIDNTDGGDEGIEGLPNGPRLGLLGAVGFEVYSKRNFAVDIQLRGTATTAGKYMPFTNPMTPQSTRVHTSSLCLGLNWY